MFRKLWHLILFRQFEAPPPVNTLQGAAYWLGQLCLFLAIALAYKTGEMLQSSSRSGLPSLELPNFGDDTGKRSLSSLESFQNISTSSLFGKSKGPEQAPTPAAQPVNNSKLKLIAVNESSSGMRMAIIEDSTKQAQDVFEVNEQIFAQARLVEIKSDRVSIERAGKLEVLALAEKEAGPAGDSTAPPGVDQTDFTVPEEELSSALANLPQLLSQARAVPYFRNGQSIGMRLFAIRSGSLYEKLGLKNGDIILSVNDNSLSDPAQALKLFEQLKNERSVAVKVERNSQLTDLRYSIR